MDKIRAEKFHQLIDLLDQADALQQELLGDEHETACYEFHCQLNDIADEFVDFANEEGIEIG
jgi:hypothetical protein